MYSITMRNPLLIPVDPIHPGVIKGIYESLAKLNDQLESDQSSKNNQLAVKDLEIKELKLQVETLNKTVGDLTQKLADITRTNEGNRQIIKKLINDVVRKQQDIEWYKRTYETRSLLGTLKEKIFGRRKSG